MAAQARRRHIGSEHAAAGHPCRAVSRVLIIVDDGDGPPQHVGLDLPPEGAWGSETRIRSRGGAVVLVDESTEPVSYTHLTLPTNREV